MTTIPTARALAAAEGLCQDGVRGRLPKVALDFLATKVEGVDYLPIKKVEPTADALEKRAERERIRLEKAEAANAAEATKREAKAKEAADKAAEKEAAKAAAAAARPSTTTGPVARVASNIKTTRVPGQPTKAYTFVYPTTEGRAAGHGAFLWSPQTCSEGHRIGYCSCATPKAPVMPGEGSLHGGGVLMWEKPASLSAVTA